MHDTSWQMFLALTATKQRDFLRGLLDRTGSATSLHGPVVGGVILYVTRLAVYLCLVGPVFGAATDVPALLKAVQNRYNRARTVQVLFQQTYRMPGRALKTESGELSLRKPGRMRWQYESPQGKLFISDGKQMFLFTPDSNRVQRMKVRESDDLRAPLGFLLGKLDFWRDFQRFVSRPEGADVRLTAVPKSEQAPYTDVEFVVTPAYQIRYLRVMGQDGSVMEFSFSDERLNPRLAESLFRFTPPPGVEVVEGVGEGGEEP
jgi:outer membrane lipoprotein carrier protein